MKRMLPLLILGFAAFTVAVGAHPPAAAPGQQGGQGGRAVERDPANTTNERDKVQIDQFFGDATNATGHLSHGGLMIRPILQHGNPNVPGPAGAVLEYRTQVAKATQPGGVTHWPVWQKL